MAKRKDIAVDIKVVGLRELRNSFRDAAGPEGGRMMRQVHIDIAKKIVEPAARREAPVKTGRLRNSIRGQATQTSATVKAGTNNRVPYAGPIHWGWPSRNIEPNQFLIRAIEKNQRKILREFKKHTDKISRKIDGSGVKIGRL